MPYDGFGNFTRDYNWTADKLASIKITSVRHDAEDDNFATALNQVILRSGVAPFSGDVKMGGNDITGIGAGSDDVPSIQFGGDATTGIYLPAAGVLGFSASGVERGRFTSTGFSVTGKLGVNTATPRTSLDVVGLTSMKGAFEDTVIAATALNGTAHIDYLTASIWMMTVNAAGDWIFNVRGNDTTTLDSIMAVNQTLSFAAEVPQGATAYRCTDVTVDGAAAASVLWQNGEPSAGAVSCVNVYLVRVTKTGAATFAVRASFSQEL